MIVVLLLSLLYCAALGRSQFTTSSTQEFPYIQNSLYTSLSSNCQSIITVCEPTILSCAVSLCHICTSLGVTPSIEPCCAAPEPTACFSSYVAGSPITYTAPAGPTGPTYTSFDTSAEACGSVENFSSSCAAATPNFEQLEFSSQASCFCSPNGTYAPTVFDGYWSTYFAWASTAAPDEYALFGPTGGGDLDRTPCQKFATAPGSFPKTTIPTIPASATATSGPLANPTASGAARTSKGSRLNDIPVSRCLFLRMLEALLTTILQACLEHQHHVLPRGFDDMDNMICRTQVATACDGLIHSRMPPRNS